MKEDFTGKKFGRLEIVKEVNKRGNRRYVLCHCDCGNEKEICLADLKRDKTKSCGCIRKETTKMIHTIHGASDSRIYRIWCAMKERCSNQSNSNYKYYGGKGISVCNEWVNNFSAFHQWAEQNGYKSNLTIERKNGNLGYSPSNCKWATSAEQNANKCNNVNITFNEQTMCMSEWARKVGLKPRSLNFRLSRGMLIKHALTTPLKDHRVVEYNNEKKSIKEWADAFGIARRTLSWRLKAGWPIEKALEMKPDCGNRHDKF